MLPPPVPPPKRTRNLLDNLYQHVTRDTTRAEIAQLHRDFDAALTPEEKQELKDVYDRDNAMTDALLEQYIQENPDAFLPEEMLQQERAEHEDKIEQFSPQDVEARIELDDRIELFATQECSDRAVSPVRQPRACFKSQLRDSPKKPIMLEDSKCSHGESLCLLHARTIPNHLFQLCCA